MSDGDHGGGIGLVEIGGLTLLMMLIFGGLAYALHRGEDEQRAALEAFISGSNGQMSVTNITDAHTILTGADVEKAIAIFDPKDGEGDEEAMIGMLCAQDSQGVITANRLVKHVRGKLNTGEAMTTTRVIEIKDDGGLVEKAEAFCQGHLEE
jgi:hypothetical protein